MIYRGTVVAVVDGRPVVACRRLAGGTPLGPLEACEVPPPGWEIGDRVLLEAVVDGRPDELAVLCRLG